MLTNIHVSSVFYFTSFYAHRVKSLTFLFSSSNAHLSLQTEIPVHLPWTSCQPWCVHNVPKLTPSKTFNP